MKITFFCALLLILMTSCYSYRNVADNENLIAEGSKVKLVLINQQMNGEVIEVQSDSIAFKRQGGQLAKIAKTEIVEIREKKFSILKTLAIPTGAWLGGYVLFKASGGVTIDLESGF